MNSLLSLSTKIQQKFTYRQRFLFFAIIFFLATPYPTYWMLHTQRALLEQGRRQKWGLGQQLALNELTCLGFGYLYLLYSYSLHKVPFSERKTELELVQRDSSQLVNQLAVSDRLQPSQTVFFYPSTPISVGSVQPLQAAVKSLLEAKEGKESTRALLFLMKEAALQMLLWSVDSSLFFDLSPASRSLVRATYELLPKNQWYLIELIAFLSKEGQEPLSAEELYRYDEALQGLRNASQEIALELDRSYHKLEQLGVDEKIVEKAKWLLHEDRQTMQKLFDALPKQASPKMLLNQPFEAYLLKNLFENNQNLYLIHLQIIETAITEKLSLVWWQRALSLFLLSAVSLLIFLFIIFRPLTSHLQGLKEHIRALAKGDFKKRYYPDSDDAFAQIGLTFNEMGEVLYQINSQVQHLGKVLADSSDYLGYDLKNHKTNIEEQSKTIDLSEKIAKEIAEKCQTHAEMIYDLSGRAAEHPLTKTTSQALDQMERSMHHLASHSQLTLLTLKDLKEKLQKAIGDSRQFEEVCDLAKRLAVSCAIESKNSPASAEFAKITEATERFAATTLQASLEIQKIFSSTDEKISYTQQSVSVSLSDIDQGWQRLQIVKLRLDETAAEAKRQLSQFKELNELMQSEAVEAKNIISSVEMMHRQSFETIEMFNVLSIKIQQLSLLAGKLKAQLKTFPPLQTK